MTSRVLTVSAVCANLVLRQRSVYSRGGTVLQLYLLPCSGYISELVGLDMPSCVVRGCKNRVRVSADREPAVTFHRLPTEQAKRKAWLHACKREEVGTNARVCSDHFHESDFERDLRAELLNSKPKKLLKPNVVPSCKLPGKSATKDVLASCGTVLGCASSNIGVSIVILKGHFKCEISLEM